MPPICNKRRTWMDRAVIPKYKFVCFKDLVWCYGQKEVKIPFVLHGGMKEASIAEKNPLLACYPHNPNEEFQQTAFYGFYLHVSKTYLNQLFIKKRV